jgi:hypothetical protein
MDDDMAERPREADILGLSGERVVGLRIVRNHDHVRVCGVFDRGELRLAHLPSEPAKIAVPESRGEVLEADLFTAQRPKVDHET